MKPENWLKRAIAADNIQHPPPPVDMNYKYTWITTEKQIKSSLLDQVVKRNSIFIYHKWMKIRRECCSIIFLLFLMWNAATWDDFQNSEKLWFCSHQFFVENGIHKCSKYSKRRIFFWKLPEVCNFVWDINFKVPFLNLNLLFQKPIHVQPRLSSTQSCQNWNNNCWICFQGWSYSWSRYKGYWRKYCSW